MWAACDCGCACVPVAWSASISWLVSGVVKATDPMEKVLKLRQTLRHFCDAATKNEHIGNCAESVCMTSSVWAVAVIRLSCVKRIMINAQETPLPAGLTNRKRYTPLRSGCSEKRVEGAVSEVPSQVSGQSDFTFVHKPGSFATGSQV